MDLDITQCTQGGLKLFPARYFCPNCGGEEWARRQVRSGTVMESTVVRHRAGERDAQALHLATVRTSEGPMVVARLIPPVMDGATVRLEVDGDQCIVALAL